MKRVRRLTQFWNWLPAFRAVAETQHLPTAANELGVSAPGLSRMIKLIERDLEVSLFHRRSRRLELNEAGLSFLEHVRDAMRRIDDGLQVLHQGTFTGPVRIAASHSICHALVLPALAGLAQSHPRLTPSILGIEEPQANAMLRKGSLDVAILERTEADDDLCVEQLGVTTYGVYCGRSHPLWQAPNCSLDDALKHGFVAPPDALDNWPLNTRREVALFVNALDLALQVCRSGRLLAFLPDDVARPHQTDLKRLPLPPLAQTPMFAAYRKPLAAADRTGALLTELRLVVAGRD